MLRTDRHTQTPMNALRPVQTERVERVDTRPIKLMFKIGSIHTDRVN